MSIRTLLTAITLALSATAAAPTQPVLTGRVVGVSDGDTLTLLTPDRVRHKVRLDQIDAPESAQPWGADAKRRLSAAVFNKTVTVRSSGKDRYGRTLGRVQAGGADINSAMVRDGSAWAYRQYLTDRRMITLEADARSANRGLWALPDSQQTPPWEWRAAQRTGRMRADAGSGQRRSEAPPAGRASLSCGAKRTCTQMSSCEEARFHLQRCSLPRLDNDRDGVPCESLCRAGA